eukprot:Gb_33282 [translate_table: standard]
MEEVKVFTMNQVSLHKRREDCWFVIGGKVYDVTKFLEEHPGGEEVLIEVSGEILSYFFQFVVKFPSLRDFICKGYSLARVMKRVWSNYQWAAFAVVMSLYPVESSPAQRIEPPNVNSILYACFELRPQATWECDLPFCEVNFHKVMTYTLNVGLDTNVNCPHVQEQGPPSEQSLNEETVLSCRELGSKSRRDATQDFEDVGHSSAAKGMMETYVVGVLEGFKSEAAPVKQEKTTKDKTAFREIPASVIKEEEPSSFLKLLQFLVPLLLVGIAFGIRFFLKEAHPSS